MKKLAILLSLFMLIGFIGLAEGRDCKRRVAKPPKKAKVEQRIDKKKVDTGEWLVLWQGGAMPFSDWDKAEFYAQDLRVRGEKSVYLLYADRGFLRDCLWTAINTTDYPKNFNKELFISDVIQYIGKGKEVEQCRNMNLWSISQLLGLMGMENIQRELNKFLEKREKG